MSIEISDDPIKGEEYTLTIKTYIGDADGLQSFILSFDSYRDLDKLKDTLLFLEVVKRQYPNGRGSKDNFFHLPFFDRTFQGSWPSFEGYGLDSYESHQLTYTCPDGIVYLCEHTFTESELSEIISYGVKV